jgi:hypothetical protein
VIVAVSLEDNSFDAACFTSRSISQYQSGIRTRYYILLKTEQSVTDAWAVSRQIGKVIHLQKRSFTNSNCELKSNSVKR